MEDEAGVRQERKREVMKEPEASESFRVRISCMISVFR